MMALVMPSKEFSLPTISWMKENSISPLSKRYRSESLPLPQVVTNGQFDPLSQHLHNGHIISPDAVKNETQQSISNWYPNNGRIPKHSSQSFTSMRTIDEKEQEDYKQQNYQSVSATTTSIRRFPIPNITWIKKDSVHSLSERIRNESLSPSTLAFEQGHTPMKPIHIENTTPLNTMTNEQQQQQQPTTNVYSDNTRASKYSSQSFSSLRNVDEKEHKEQLTKASHSKHSSICSLSKQPPYGNKQSTTIFGSETNSPTKYLHMGDLTPLDPTIDGNQRSNSNSRSDSNQTVKYNFRSSDSMTNIYGKHEENQQIYEKNRRKVGLCSWQNSECFQTLGCLCAITACAIGIAALIFAIVSYRSTLPETTITTTTTSSTTSTTSTSTTTTTITTTTTTITTTITTTATTSSTSSSTSTSSTTMCSTTKMTTTVTITSLPSQCLSYKSINDPTRLSSYTGGSSSCDQTLFPIKTLVRFTGVSGISLANCPVTLQHCGTDVPGWYSGVYPAKAGNITVGVVCYNWAKDTCSWQSIISITNCNGYYVYELSAPPTCNARYCTI